MPGPNSRLRWLGQALAALVLVIGAAGPWGSAAWGTGARPGAAQKEAPAASAGAAKEDDEVRLGRQAAAALEREYKLVRNVQQLARLRRIGEEIAAVSDEPGYRYTFKILDTEEVNALSLPGGFTYVTKGMLSYVRSDEELAGVLAHEIAHAAKHHVRDLRRRESAANQYVIIGVLSALLLGRLHSSGLGNMLFGAEIVKTAYLNQYGQEAETEADRAGVEYLIKTGKYNPVGILTVIERLARDEERQAGPQLGVFRTHPPGRQRVEALESYLRAQNVSINRRAVQDQLRASARDTSTDDRSAAQVRLGEEVIYETAAGLPEAQRVAARLSQLILDGAEMRDVRVADDEVTVTLRGEALFSVTPADAALVGKPAAEVAQAAARTIAHLLWRAFVEQVS